MKILGISGRDRDAAAALSIDGRVVSAASEESFARVSGIGYARTGGYPRSAIQACLDAAAIDAAQIDEIVAVDDTAPAFAELKARTRTIDGAEADARHAAMTDPDTHAIVICGANPHALSVFRNTDAGLGERRDVAGAAGLFRAADALAVALGVRDPDALAALDRLGAGAEAEYKRELEHFFQLSEDAATVSVVPDDVVNAVRKLAGEHGPALGDGASLNARVQRARGAAAASFVSTFAAIVSRVAGKAATSTGARRVGLGGAAFSNPRFNSELQAFSGESLSFAAVPETQGRALGAAGVSTGGGSSALGLGPSFTEEAIKRTLDNCRLDYVYEPDWPRLLRRVSRMLSQGKTVGWFQGPMAFGPRPHGSRSILADPSNRYARQNINEYLRERPLDDPLPLAVAPSMAVACFSASQPSFGSRDVEVRPEWRAALASAIDARHRARVHASTATSEPRFQELLEHHHTASGVPGLIEINLAATGEPIACTPRDAVRTMYSSALDALVIGRFLLMKDYWLLRSQDQ